MGSKLHKTAFTGADSGQRRSRPGRLLDRELAGMFDQGLLKRDIARLWRNLRSKLRVSSTSLMADEATRDALKL